MLKEASWRSIEQGSSITSKSRRQSGDELVRIFVKLCKEGKSDGVGMESIIKIKRIHPPKKKVKRRFKRQFQGCFSCGRAGHSIIKRALLCSHHFWHYKHVWNSTWDQRLAFGGDAATDKGQGKGIFFFTIIGYRSFCFRTIRNSLGRRKLNR